MASLQARRPLVRTAKATKDIQAKGKRLMREMLVFWKKNEKEERDLRRRAEKEADNRAKEEEERREAARQARKLEFLISQTELYSHFVGSKLKSKHNDQLVCDASIHYHVLSQPLKLRVRTKLTKLYLAELRVPISSLCRPTLTLTMRTRVTSTLMPAKTRRRPLHLREQELRSLTLRLPSSGKRTRRLHSQKPRLISAMKMTLNSQTSPVELWLIVRYPVSVIRSL